MKKLIYFSIASMVMIFSSCEKQQNNENNETDKQVVSPVDPVVDPSGEDPVIDTACHFRTQTPGGWGAKPSGNNPGTYLHKNFVAAFPNGLTVGCNTGFTLKLTTAQAITDFLPCGGTPRALTANYTNVTCDPIKNVLAGHLVALTLSVTFDVNDSTFGLSPTSLGNLVIASGTFQGWTVNQLIAEANNALGGCATIYSFSDLSGALTSINESFVGGKSGSTSGFLKCPTGGGGPPDLKNGNH